MNQRTVLIVILTVIFLIIAYRSWKKVTIEKTNDEAKTTISVTIKKEPQKE